MSLELSHKSEITELKDIHILHLNRYYLNYFPKRSAHLYSKQCMRDPVFPLLLQHCTLTGFFISASLTGKNGTWLCLFLSDYIFSMEFHFLKCLLVFNMFILISLSLSKEHFHLFFF